MLSVIEFATDAVLALASVKYKFAPSLISAVVSVTAPVSVFTLVTGADGMAIHESTPLAFDDKTSPAFEGVYKLNWPQEYQGI